MTPRERVSPRWKRALLGVAILVTVYVAGCFAAGHRATLSELRRPANPIIWIDFNFQWQASLWRPLVTLERLVRSEEVVVTVGIVRSI